MCSVAAAACAPIDSDVDSDVDSPATATGGTPAPVGAEDPGTAGVAGDADKAIVLPPLYVRTPLAVPLVGAQAVCADVRIDGVSTTYHLPLAAGGNYRRNDIAVDVPRTVLVRFFVASDSSCADEVRALFPNDGATSASPLFLADTAASGSSCATDQGGECGRYYASWNVTARRAASPNGELPCPGSPAFAEADANNDGQPDTCDAPPDYCPDDPEKTDPGQCGCGVPDTDSDNDIYPDCYDGCPNDPDKMSPGECGCGVSDEDLNEDGVADCHGTCVLPACDGNPDFAALFTLCRDSEAFDDCRSLIRCQGLFGSTCDVDPDVCGEGYVCRENTCTLCGNGVVDAGEACDDGNTYEEDGCTSTCELNECADNVIFAVGVYGTTSCDQRCASEGMACVGIGTDSGATNEQYWECFGRNSGVATETAAGSCGTVLGGDGCSEYTQCRCKPVWNYEAIFAVGVYGTTTCASRCASQGQVCAGIGTNEDATNGQYYECFGATTGVATQTAAGSCDTVLGGDGCSEYTNCNCREPNDACAESIFAVGVYGTTTCASRCASQGQTCVGIGSTQNASDDRYFSCFGANSGVATQTAPGTCNTVLGGNGCSEYAYCACL